MKWNLSTKEIIQILGLLVAGFMFWLNFNLQIAKIESRVLRLEEINLQYTNQNTLILSKLDNINDRIIKLETKIEERNIYEKSK